MKATSCVGGRGRVRYSDADIRLLAEEVESGVRPVEIARRLGVSKQRVQQLLARIGFRVQRVWTAEDLRLLGTMSDNEVAKRTGRHTTTVCAKRNRLGIEPCRRLPGPRGPVIDRVGERPGHGKLLLLRLHGRERNGVYRWICRCEVCGQETKPLLYSNIGKQKSCGCVRYVRGKRKGESE